MSKFRIVKLGNTDTYLVQKRFFGFFWVDIVGKIIPLTLNDARRCLEVFEKDYAREKVLKGPRTVVSNKGD